MRLLLRVLLCLLAFLIAFGVVRLVKDPAGAVNWLADRSGYERETDIAYGDLPRQKLDIYRPAYDPEAEPPVVVFFYGGAWSSGNRDDYRFVGQFLASQGFTVVIPDYRLRPEVAFPAFLEDGAKVLRWTQDHIAIQGGDPRRIFLIGHSAGAYNAMMLALDRRYAEAVGFDSARIKGAVGLAGPYDFARNTDMLRAVFGTAPDPRDTQPVNFAAAGAPAVMLVMGGKDDTVNPENSRSLARHLEAVHSQVLLRELPGVGHLSVVLLLSRIGWPDRAVQDEIVRFLKAP